MKAQDIRSAFLNFFQQKSHKIVPSAPLVNKDDPTLMFVNAGMNQFKDYFLGNKEATDVRVADTQKCLRVSGKHNDLEEVGLDSYHHTMFEMLGNWSFGDYFKEEAIEWAWEFLTEVLKLDKDRIYVSIFAGDPKDDLPQDSEASGYWEKWVPKERILPFDKKDNFWEMGETGPCGPCSEIHVDLRSDKEQQAVDGATLVNEDHPQVIEIWNLVFIQYNRKANGDLEELPAKHIDTGMGFERLCMVMQNKTSSYDTDLFTPMIHLVEQLTGKKYDFSYASEAKADMAFRVIVDHIRAVSFAIADGQETSNTGAGYVIRRILRRAVRYYYSFLDYKEPMLYRLVPELARNFKSIFPELDAQQDYVSKRILEEEKMFLRTLESGLRRLDTIKIENETIDGETAFELYDTYGFPFDLTQLIAEEKGFRVDAGGFAKAMEAQKARSRKDAEKEVGDWIALSDEKDVEFLGYDELEATAKVIKHRTVTVKGKEQFQIVLNRTPFYAEGGGQVGDTGLLLFGEEKIPVIDTKKENDLIIHFVKALPQKLDTQVKAIVHEGRRRRIEDNHTATHLAHAALRQILGPHVAQKGSLVYDKGFRFDFSHFQKLSEEEIRSIEQIVNQKIRENIELEEQRSIPIEKAQKAGAMMLFGEKYGDTVRMITFDPEYSVELCGGCHVPATGKIGQFRITSESSIAAGIRRIEAVTGVEADSFVNQTMEELNGIKSLFKNPKNLPDQILSLQEENKQLRKELEKLAQAKAGQVKQDLLNQIIPVRTVNFLGAKIDIDSADSLKKISHDLRNEVDNLFAILGTEIGGKALLAIAVSDKLTWDFDLDAGKIIREVARNIQGGGGGQAFFATAGGKNPDGIEAAIEQAKQIIDERSIRE
ncbi:MAG: alanine--tRNA ligase [Bacteroidota bacterium]